MVYRKHPNQRRFLPILNQSQENPKAALAAWAGRQGPKASPLITLLTILSLIFHKAEHQVSYSQVVLTCYGRQSKSHIISP